MNEIGKLLVLVGIVFVCVGGLLSLFGKVPLIGKLPGDFIVKKENFTFYFPLATCLLLSLLLNVLFFIFNKR